MRSYQRHLHAVCMVLIAASLGAVLYLAFKLDAALRRSWRWPRSPHGARTHSVSSRLRDRRELGDQIADLSRGTGDLARQVAEISRRLNAMEAQRRQAVDRARSAVDPLAAEIGELGGLVRQIAETVAAHMPPRCRRAAQPAPPSPSRTRPCRRRAD